MTTKNTKRVQLPGPKVTPEVEIKLNNLAARIGMDSVYQMLSLCVDALIKYMDKDCQLDPELQKLIDMFERFEGWGQVCALTSSNPKWSVAEAVYFIRDEDKCGYTACWVKKPFFGDAKATFNKRDILDMVIRRAFPAMNRRLDLMGMQLSTSCHADTINQLLSDNIEDPNDIELREMFADCGRNEFGKDLTPTKYIKRKRKDIERIKGINTQLDMFDNNEQGQEL